MASAESRRIRAMFGDPAAQPAVSPEVGRREWEAAVVDVPLPPDVALEPIAVGALPGAWLRPSTAAPDTALLFAHGGGYNAGSWRTHRELAARLALAARMPVLLFDYRLAPENPFPAAVDDAVAAYRWLLAQGFAAERLAVGGDSAGGGLAAALLLALRAAGHPLPAAGVLLSPWLDLGLTGPSMESQAAIDPLTTRAALARAADWYLGAADPRHPLASPLYGDLAGLPPLLIQVGAHEVLQSDATRFAERIAATGGAAILEVWDEMWHVWHGWAAELPEGRQAIERLGSWLQERLGRVR